jgi:hypothetical protein
MQSILLAMHTVTLSRESRNKDEAEKVKSHVFLASHKGDACAAYMPYRSGIYMQAWSNVLEAQDKTTTCGLFPNLRTKIFLTAK